MHALHWIAEQRIREAIEAGELDHIPGMGQPLNLDSDNLIDPEARLAYTILKNSGFLPYPLLLRKEIEQSREELEKFLENGRYRLQRMLATIEANWQEALSYVGDEPALMKRLRIRQVPEDFHPSRTAVSPRSLRGRKKLANKLATLQRFVVVYNETIEGYKRKYVQTLNEINNKISSLSLECLKEEIRRRRPLTCVLAMHLMDIPGRVEKFDREFQKFVLTPD